MFVALLKRTITLVVQLSREPADRLLAYSNSNWAEKPQDRTSTTCYVFYLGNSPVSWYSKKKKSVSRSSTEVEQRVIVIAISEVNWLTNLLRELNLLLFASPTVLCDNVSTTYICANPVFQSRMKHIAIDFHFVHEQVQQMSLAVYHLHSVDQVVDVLTKPLPIQLLTSFSQVGSCSSHPQLAGAY